MLWINTLKRICQYNIRLPITKQHVVLLKRTTTGALRRHVMKALSISLDIHATSHRWIYLTNGQYCGSLMFPLMLFVKVMACGLFSTKPLFNPMVTWWQLNQKGTISQNTIKSRKCPWKRLLKNNVHFVGGISPNHCVCDKETFAIICRAKCHMVATIPLFSFKGLIWWLVGHRCY